MFSRLPHWARVVLSIVAGYVLAAIVSVFPGFVVVLPIEMVFGPQSSAATFLERSFTMLLWIIFGVWVYRRISSSTRNIGNRGTTKLQDTEK